MTLGAMVKPRVRSRQREEDPAKMNDTAQPLIHLDKVTKVFLTDEVETHALEEIDLDIYPGEYIAIS